MQADIISQIIKMKNIRDVVILTHNIDFIFLQTVFLSSLKSCGQPSLTVFADAQCCQESYSRQVNIIKDLGSRYRVIPVSMNPGFRFHPKVILLSGDTECYLYTGSGNLTFGGIRENGEVWNKYEVNGNEVPTEMSAIKQYLSAILPYVGLPDEVEKDIEDVFLQERHLWVKALQPANGLWFQPGSEGSLLTRMQKKLSGRQINSIKICTPYFDKKANALNQLSAAFDHPPIELYIQSKRSTLIKSAAESLTDNITIKSLQANSPGALSNRFMHAKWYAFDVGDGIELFSGSANCSNAALLLYGNQGNAELMAESKLSYIAFNDVILSELIINDELPELIESLDEGGEEELIGHKISITGARYNYGQLLVAYRASKQILITGLTVDDKEVEFTFDMSKENQIQCFVDCRPSRVILIGEYGSEQVISNLMWVDNESLLRSNSVSRQVISAIQNVKEVGENDPRQWIMLFDLLSQNLQQRSSRESRKILDEKKGDSTPVKLHKDLLASKGYSYGLSLPLLNIHCKNQSQNIYSMLLSSFGLNEQEQTEERILDENYDDDCEVDQPDKMPEKQNSNKKVGLSKRHSSRLLELVSTIIDEICKPDFVLIREPDLLSRDIQVVAILVRKLYSMGWIEQNEFFQLTHKAWSQLFFSTKNDKTKGLMQLRFEATLDPQKFIDLFVTPGLVAALYGWFSAVRFEVTDVYSYRYMLSQLMAMGRCPWLWHLDEEKQQLVIQQLARIWQDSPCPHHDAMLIDVQMSQFTALIEPLFRQGLALTHFEYEMTAHDPILIRETIKDISVEKGEIIWQVSSGLCVTLEDSKFKNQLEVLSMQRPEKSSKFQTDKLIPLKSVLAHKEFFSDDFLMNYKYAIDEFIDGYDLTKISI
tara:strand:- start:2544 stop:5183 length:2640 start_codon:yes stop_codon:yes gene_type:complete